MSSVITDVTYSALYIAAAAADVRGSGFNVSRIMQFER